MVVQVRESSIEGMAEKLKGMKTELNKIVYLESALKVKGFTYEIKRFLWGTLFELYEVRGMYDKAGKVLANKAGAEVTFRDQIESYLKAGELFAKAGKVEDAEEMFFRAGRNANFEQKQRVKLAMRNIFLVSAKALEKKGRKASALKFYERLIKLNLDELEKTEIKEKLLKTYRALGKFREAKLLEGV